MTTALWAVTAYALQFAAIVIVALVAIAALGIRRPRHALMLWQAVMSIALLLPLAQPRGGDPAGLQQLLSSSTTTIASDPSASQPSLDWATIILSIVAAGIVLRLLWLAIGLIRLRAIVRRTDPANTLADIRDGLAASLGVTAELRVSDDLDGPATVGVRRPIVLLPRPVMTMSPAVQRAIICHELLHIRRRDWIRTIVEEAWCAILWFHPLARILASRLSLAREMVVDEATILITRDRRAYAEALLAFSDPQPHVMGVTPFIGLHTLSQRIALIASEASMSRRPALLRSGIALVLTIGIAAVAAAQLPMFATVQAQSTVYEAGNGITLPVVVAEVRPDYTQEAKQQKIQGSVWLQAVIDATGAVTDVQVTKSLDAEYGLDRRAMEAVYQWKFKPATKDGKPVAFRVTLEMTFTLK